MSGDNSASRQALGDITNRPEKRGLLIPDKPGVKSGNGCGKIVNDEDGESQLAQGCLGVEIIVNEKFRSNCVVNDNQRSKRPCVSPRPCSEINSLKGNVISSISRIPIEVKDSNPSGGSICVASNEGEGAVDAGDASRFGSVSGMSVVTGSTSHATDFFDLAENCNNDERVIAKAEQSERLSADACRSHSVDRINNLASNGNTSVEGSRQSKSLGIKFFELERCIGLKGDGSSNSSTGVDLIKACSCSFCMKAAYIWSDLHYQDIKGRIAALKKSQKEASILVQRSCRDKGVNKHGERNSNKSSKLEYDLMGQWKSLFLHMEEIFVRESSQLEANLLTLKDMRENCKTELETTGVTHMEKQ